MSESIASQVSKLQQMTVAELRIEWERMFGEPTKQRHRVYLWKRLARAIQGDTGPKLTEEEEAKVTEYRAMLKDMPPEKWFPGKQRGKSKAKKPTRDRRMPPPGSVISRQYKGNEIIVRVLDDGFEYEKTWYRSLSAVAKAVTGTTWNGWTFFGLSNPEKSK